MLFNRLIPMIALAGTMMFTAAASATRPCPPDIDCSGTVNVTDLLSVINAWGGSGPSDVNGDGIVNVSDLLAVINAWGPCRVDYGPAFANEEAHQIGLEMLGPIGPLDLSQAAYDRIVRDVGLIRAAYPGLASQFHSPAWVPNQILVSVSNPQNADYVCHNAYYQVTGIQHLFSTWYELTFASKSNIPKLAAIYAAGANVTYAEPNGYIGGQNFWRPADQGDDVWRWEIDDGFTDCTDGCDCHRYYIIDIDGPGNVTLISYSEYGAPWCDFGGR